MAVVKAKRRGCGCMCSYWQWLAHSDRVCTMYIWTTDTHHALCCRAQLSGLSTAQTKPYTLNNPNNDLSDLLCHMQLSGPRAVSRLARALRTNTSIAAFTFAASGAWLFCCVCNRAHEMGYVCLVLPCRPVDVCVPIPSFLWCGRPRRG